MEDYSKKTDSKKAFSQQIFRIFTDACGGGTEYEFADELYGKFTIEDFGYHDDMVYWGVHAYFKDVVVPHKIAVYKGGLDLILRDIPKKLKFSEDEFKRNLWRHDMSKFSANEAFGYASYNRHTGSGKKGFELAWHHHKMHNPHHPEHWLNPNRSGELEVLPMPAIYVAEMVADWIGAGKTYGSTLEEWLPDNIGKFKLHIDSAITLKYILLTLGIDLDISYEGQMSVKSLATV